MPGTSDTFYAFSGTSISNANVAFTGYGAGGQHGVYTVFGDALSVLVDLNTSIPGGAGDFTGFVWPAISNQDVAFVGLGTGGQSGVYASVGGVLGVVADENTPIPGGSGNFVTLGFSQPAMSDAGVAFYGSGSGQYGIYSSVGGLHPVADTDTQVPGEDGTFFDFAFTTSMFDEDVAFMAWTEPFDATKDIYVSLDGELIRVIGEGDILDGLTVANVLIAREALDGDQLAFNVRFSDDSHAIYLATIPEPASLALLGLAALALRRTKGRYMR